MPADRLHILRRDQGGATLPELAVVVVLVVVFISIFIDRVWELRIAAERAGVEHTIGTLRSALGLEIVARITRGKGQAELQDLEGSNPIALLEWPPENYIGELESPDLKTIEGYRWYFDRKQRLLIYRVANGANLESPLSGPARIRFAVRVDYHGQDGGGAFEPGKGTIRGVDIVPVESYRWRRH